MPGVYRYTINRLGQIVDKALKLGIPMIALFPKTQNSKKDELGTESLNEKNLEITDSPISAGNLSKLINLIKDGTISGKIAKTVFELMLDGDKDPQKIVEEKGLKQQSDPKAIEALIDKIINDNREKAIEYKQGKEKLFGFFVGQAMKASGGKANPQLINEILRKKLQ